MRSRYRQLAIPIPLDLNQMEAMPVMQPVRRVTKPVTRVGMPAKIVEKTCVIEPTVVATIARIAG